eukprot:gene13373-15400_t
MAQLGLSKVLKTLHDRGYNWDEKTALHAIRDNRLACLKFLYNAGCEITPVTLCGAAKYGSIECMEFLHAQGVEWHDLTCYYAARFGQLATLTYAHTHGAEWNELTSYAAASYGHLDCLIYLHKHDCMWNERALKGAIAGWYLTDLCAQRHSECGCSIQFQPRNQQSFVHAEPSLSTPVVGLKRSAESSESLIPEPTKQSRTTAIENSAAFNEDNFDLNDLDNMDDLDELNMLDIPCMDGEDDDYGFQFLLCSRIMTSANLVDCTQLPDWLALEIHRRISGCRSEVLLQAIVTVLAQAIQRYKDYHGAAFNFQATVLQVRYNYLLNAVEFQANILGAVKLVAREADALDALQAQTTQTRVLSVLSTIYNTEVHADCAQGYFQLALSWERSGNFEMKTKFLSRALFIFLQLCNSSSSASNSTSSSSRMVATTSNHSLKYSMLEPMYYLACLRFRTWCRDDFLRQKKMLEWCRISVDVALQENNHNIDRWTKLCLLKAKILQSLAITHGELVEVDRRNFVHKKDILSEAVNLRLQLYDNNESHIEVARTQMHAVINQYELDQNMDNKRVGLKRIYKQMERYYGTTEHTEMAWVLRSIAEATPDKKERREILEQVLKTQYALLTDKAAFNFSIQRTKLLIDATYEDRAVAGGTAGTGAGTSAGANTGTSATTGGGVSASPPASTSINVITPSAQGALVIVQLEEVMSQLSALFQNAVQVSQEQTNTLLSNIMDNCC